MSVYSFDTLGDLQYCLKCHDWVVLDCWANFCGPCKRMAPSYVKLAEEFPEICFTKVDVQAAADVAQEYDIHQLPTFVLFEKGKEKKNLRLIGADVAALKERLAQLLLQSSNV